MTIRGDIEEIKHQEENDKVGITKELRQKLDNFQDMKLGVIFHWGLYSQAGIVESWQLSEEDDWAREKPWRKDLATLRQDYWDLSYSFNPIKFNPQNWAEKCRAAGFKYMIFTTKHHDGFTMYDTKLSDYKVTSPRYPFHANLRSNILKEVLEAFRKENMMVGVYYSKADWHSPFYWVPGERPKGRYTSYNVLENPMIWQRFVQFVHGQLTEIMQDYGKIDILWLDAGWVGPQTNEDLNMSEIAKKLRNLQRNLIIVDRTIGGAYENYVTPERSVPIIPPKKTWESNVPLANNWGYVPNDNYKSLKEIIHLLVQVVSKGGNLLLGVGPKPDGTLPQEAEKLLDGIGKWMEKYQEGIYGTRPVKNKNQTVWHLTKKENCIFAYYLIEGQKTPKFIDLRKIGIEPNDVLEVLRLDSGEKIDSIEDDGIYLLTVSWEELAFGLKIICRDKKI